MSASIATPRSVRKARLSRLSFAAASRRTKPRAAKASAISSGLFGTVSGGSVAEQVEQAALARAPDGLRQGDRHDAAAALRAVAALYAQNRSVPDDVSETIARAAKDGSGAAEKRSKTPQTHDPIRKL